MTRLGRLYEKGLGCPKDTAKAEELYKKQWKQAMKKPKPTWPGFMDEIEAVKKHRSLPMLLSLLSFFQENGSPKPHSAALLCLPAYGYETA